jgi:hypothetical protein
MGQGDPGGQYQAGVIVGPIFHNICPLAVAPKPLGRANEVIE